MDETELEKRARERVQAIRGLYTHLGIYVVVIGGLFLINLVSRGEDGGWWFYWPAIGWGIGVGAHVVAILTGAGSRLDAWEDRKVHELVDRERTRV